MALTADVKRLKKGDRVVIPFTISCGSCWFCQQTLYSLCDTTNRNPELAKKAMGFRYMLRVIPLDASSFASCAARNASRSKAMRTRLSLKGSNSWLKLTKSQLSGNHVRT